jgi:hypothetical protein
LPSFQPLLTGFTASILVFTTAPFCHFDRSPRLFDRPPSVISTGGNRREKSFKEKRRNNEKERFLVASLLEMTGFIPLLEMTDLISLLEMTGLGAPRNDIVQGS